MAIDPTSGKNPYEQLGLTSNREQNKKEDSDPASVGQDQFLELMMAQLKNQDPTSPQDNGEFMTQMATFSQAQGMKELTETFTNLAEDLSSNQALQASSMIGRSVLAPGESVRFDGENAAGGAIQLDSSAQDVSVSVYDSSGQEVRNMQMGQLPEGRHFFSWDGTDGDGNPLPAGNYQISAEGLQEGENKTLETSVLARVDSVSMGSGGQGMKLNLAGGETLGLDKIQEIM
jgi:flagellar basal-body rod modification protein FlgD